MTEKEWATCQWTEPMLMFLGNTPGLLYKTRVQCHPRGRRKLRLLGVAVARRVEHLTDNPKFPELIETAEAIADGKGKAARLKQLLRESGVPCFHGIPDGAEEYVYHNYLAMCSRKDYAEQAVAVLGCGSAGIGGNSAALALEGVNLIRETARQCDLVRDIFGNPFRPVTFPKQWRTADIVGLARQAYDARDFSTLPVLADALEDAGCEDADILAHCRGPHEGHVRGCWVVDHVLAKA